MTAADPETECATLAKGLSSGGSFWTQQYQQPSEPPLTMVCIMSFTSTSYEAEVDDDGGGFNGRQVCSAFTQAGWVENTVAEQQRASAAYASAAASSAGAVSSAAAEARQAQLSQDQQAATSATTSLKQDSEFGSDLAALATDVKATDVDLGTTRSDAAQGAGDYCTNVNSTVFNDAASTVFNDAQSSYFNDLQTLARDIGTTRTDVTSLQAALKQLTIDGLPAPSGSSGAIASAISAIASALAAGNIGADQVNGDVLAAYRVANGMATGSCAGMGPGNPPAGVHHIS